MEELSKYILCRINTQQSESKMKIFPPKNSELNSLSQNEKPLTIELFNEHATTCCFTPKDLVVGYDSGIIKFWSIENQKWYLTVDNHTTSITSLTYHKKGEIVSSSMDGIISVWDVNRNEQKYIITQDKSMFVYNN